MMSEGDTTFGQATDSLTTSLISGDVPPAYQSGWPRTRQFALKLSF
jgi:hypothetical protein